MSQLKNRGGRPISEKSKRIIALRNSGMKNREIVAETGYSYTSIAGVIHKAIQRGECRKFQFTGTGTTARKRANRLGMKLGSIQQSLSAAATIDIQYSIVLAAEKGGYGTVAEYLVDLAIDAHFEETEK